MEMLVIDTKQLSDDYRRVEQAILYLEKNAHHQPGLKEIADSVNLSEYHFQRLFTRWVGISPKRFLQFLTKERAKQMLERSENLLDITYEMGLSSPGRLHDLFVACEAVTPGEYKAQGDGLSIKYGFHFTPFGECLIGVTERGISNLLFVQNGNHDEALRSLRKRWQNAELVEDADQTRPFVQQIFNHYTNRDPSPLNVFLNGTNFQIKVWEALLRIPPGAVVSYEALAASIGMPKAARAVSNAVSQNPIPVLIPCHRVIRKMGEFGGYRWGTARKKALLGWEMAKWDVQ